MNDFLLITKALADPNRIRALCALKDNELCVCQITELLNLAPSTISKHLSVLKTARLVRSRKQGRWNYYRLAGKNAPGQTGEAVAWVLRSMKSDPLIAGDRKRMRKILKIHPEELCHRQARN